MFSVIHKKGTVKLVSIFLIFIFIIGLLPQLDATANPVNQVDSPPVQLEMLEGNQIDLVTIEGKSVTFELHVKALPAELILCGKWLNQLPMEALM